MLQQFKSMNELVTYLGALEERLKHWKAENEKLRTTTSPREIVNEEAIERVVLDYLPRRICSTGVFETGICGMGSLFCSKFDY